MRITLVTSDSGDWAGVYVNGRLHYQGHSIPDNIWLGLLKGEEHEVPSGALEEMGDQFPTSFGDIIWTAPEPLGRVNPAAAERSGSIANG